MNQEELKELAKGLIADYSGKYEDYQIVHVRGKGTLFARLTYAVSGLEARYVIVDVNGESTIVISSFGSVINMLLGIED